MKVLHKKEHLKQEKDKMLAPSNAKNLGVHLAFVLHQEGQKPTTIELNKSKLLIGSFEHADIRLEGSTIAHYHTLVTIEADGTVHILDLHSKNGTYINGQMISSSVISSGDRLTIGNCHLAVEEVYSPTIIDDRDKHVDVMLAPILPPIGNDQHQKGLVLIDGEYCNITFDESNLHMAKSPLLESFKYQADSANDVLDFSQNAEANINIVRPIEGDSIEVTVCINGIVNSIEYLNLSNAQYAVSHTIKNNKTLLIPSAEPQASFISVIGNEIVLVPLTHHELYIDGELKTQDAQITLKPGQVAFYQRSTTQIFIRYATRPPKLSHPPFFGRDHAFKIQVAKWVSGASVLMLLLLLVDTKMPEPEKVVPVIYKRAEREEKAQDAQKNSNVDKQEGQRPDSSKDKQLAATKTAQANQDIPTQSPKPTPTASAAPAEAMPKPKAMQAYKFEFTNSVASAMNANNSANVDISAQKSTGKSGLAMNVPSSASGDLLAKTGQVQIGRLGGAGGGSAASGAGAQGLVARNGIDTAYVEPKTVVLGSMDPELLRRILQEHIPQFRHCYQQELAAHSDRVKGVVDLNFRIDKDGGVSNVDIRSKGAAFSPTGQGCMAKVLGLITFPRPKGGGVVDVRQPLNFFSENNKF